MPSLYKTRARAHLGHSCAGNQSGCEFQGTKPTSRSYDHTLQHSTPSYSYRLPASSSAMSLNPEGDVAIDGLRVSSHLS